MASLSAYPLSTQPLYGKIPSTQHTVAGHDGDDDWIDQQQTQLLVSPRSQQSGQKSTIRATCKALSLSWFYHSCKRLRGESCREEAKVAITNSRRTALGKGIVHLLPLSAAIVLITLNLLEYYIGGELAGWSGQDTEKLAALQFAAKWHELLMLASIGAIVFNYVRQGLISEGLPFGAVAAGLQISSLSFLWSPEMGGILMHNWNSRRKKLTLIPFLFCMTLLAASVGPSTAILMRPRLDYWPAGGTYLWVNGTEDVLKPRSISDDVSLQNCVNYTGSAACPYMYWESVSQQYLSAWPSLGSRDSVPSKFSLPGNDVSVTLQVTASGPAAYANARCMATASPFFLGEYVAELSVFWALAAHLAWKVRNGQGQSSRYTFRAENSFEIVNAWQPGVQALCQTTTLEANATSQMAFPNMTAYNHALEENPYSRPDIVSIPFNDSGTANDLEILLRKQSHGVMWLDDQELLMATNSSINAVVVVSFNDQSHDIHMCSIDARYVATTVASDRDQLGRSVWGSVISDWVDNGFHGEQFLISPMWARYVDPVLISSNSSVMQQTLQSYYHTSYGSSFVEAMLSSLLVNGLVRSVATPEVLGQLRDGDLLDERAARIKNSWVWCLLPKSKMCTVDSVFNATQEQQAGATKLQFAVLNQGYSYSSKGAPSIAAVSVLVAYVICASIHFVYMYISGSTSDAWDSPSEITALAMQSQASRYLENTGAGFETTHAFEQRVRIRAKDNVLAYVFNDTQYGAKNVEANKKYS